MKLEMSHGKNLKIVRKVIIPVMLPYDFFSKYEEHQGKLFCTDTDV